jgi:hypothetical protein
MKYVLEKQLFNSLLRYVISNNQNPDASRCNLVDIIVGSAEYQLTLCFNEQNSRVVICGISNLDGEYIEDEDIVKQCFDELILAMSEEIIDNDIIKFYHEKIEPATECCELNQ